MTTSHTPGPWIISGYDIAAPAARTVAVVCEADDEGDANARLIAASPALLEALQHMVDMYQRHFDVMPVAWQTADDIARAAIAQATGDAA